MRFSLRFVSQTSACFELENDLAYYAPEEFDVILNGKPLGKKFNTNVFSLFTLAPGAQYTVSTTLGGFSLEFSTVTETACLNVKDFAAIQTALDACPPGGRVYVPEGVYTTGPLLFGSDITLELAKGAVVRASTNPNDFPIWPGEVPSGPDGAVLQVSTWEGNPQSCYQSVLSAFYKHDIRIIGEGVLDGDAQNSDWWVDVKNMKIFRPRMLFVNKCERVYMHGVTVRNSPSWNLHPFFSRDIGFYNIAVEAPKDSPNTDGCDPESCDRVEVIGVRFSVGDDAVALKSGKVYMGAKYQTPATNHTIRNCLMEYAHGGVVLGSEIAGGVRDLDVRQCFFDHTDRGLRIKTRRGRGENCVIDGVVFDNIKMKNVLTPLVINMYYHCDPDGKTEYVWSREAAPVDERTPRLGLFHFKNIECRDCEYAAGYFDGLPEQPIGGVIIENVSFTVNPNAGEGYPAMMTKIDLHSKRGLIFRNVKSVTLKNVSLAGHEGETVTLENVGSFTEE
ncbi:MAG: glycoside hydrolase family 28 protein [Oscillospiraceae bacterium]|jgi:polygalacturonase|nr:glycoside hydrolase family 28 protein [Oscillospiraceae bacterium]